MDVLVSLKFANFVECVEVVYVIYRSTQVLEPETRWSNKKKPRVPPLVKHAVITSLT